jgi:acylphosphatase
MPTVVRLQIHGRVQGVFFRQSTLSEARVLGVLGFVRNLDDGTVEAFLAGEPAAVEKLIDFCRKGPPYAAVEKVERFDHDLTDDDYERDFRGHFQVR